MTYESATDLNLQKSLDALCDPTRRAVLEGLRRGPRSVTEIAERLPVSRPAVSQHLKRLSDAGLVQMHRAGTRRMYAANVAGLTPLRAYLEEFWADVLGAFGEFVEQQGEEK